MKVALCAIGRLENNYIREWLEHYKMLGFNHIFLYDNNYDGEEHFEDVIGDYIDSGFVDVINYRNKQVCQIKAYDECYHSHSNEYDWIAFFDIDEFMILEKYNNINDFLNQNIFKDCDGIRVCWKQFTDSGLVRVINGNYNCMNRFTEIIPLHKGQALHCKTIFKTKNKIMKFTNAHGCYDKRLKLKNCVGDVCNNTNFNIGNKTILKGAWLNHYRYKTIEEFIKTKLKRCYPDKTVESARKGNFNINTFFKKKKKTDEKIKIARQFGFNI